MTLDKLYKLANEFRGWKRGIIPEGRKNGRFCAWVDERKVAEVDYTEHCRNNFMRALEALKEEFDYRCKVGTNQERITELDNLISELEDVK